MTSKSKDRRMRRETAARLLEGVTARIKEVNANPSYCYEIKRAVVFGSFANSDREDLGDLDIAIELAPKYDLKGPECEEARSRYRGGDFILRHVWPREEVLKYIRNRSAWISIHVIGRDPEQDALIFGDRTIEIDLGAGE